MKGYTRDPEMVEKLVEAVREALYANPNLRLGQLIVNATGIRDSSDLFNVYDETLLHNLRGYTRQ